MDPQPNTVVQPKFGEHHNLFGTRLLKLHKFRDPRWQPSDKIDQYDGITRLYDVHNQLQSLSKSSEEKQTQIKLATLQKELASCRDKLKNALQGDINQIKIIFMKYKDMQNAYKSLPIAKIVENLDLRTFQKRKELDRLISEREKLSEKYRGVLIALANHQDRVKYLDEVDFPHIYLIRDVQVEIQNSETRLRTLKSINEFYRRTITNLQRDAHFFEPTLKSLQEDSSEQNDLIGRAIKMGTTALDILRSLTKEYIELETRDQNERHFQTIDITENRKKMMDNVENVKKCFQDNTGFKIDFSRYNRETPDMIQLKEQYDQLNDTIQRIKMATSVPSATRLMERIKHLNKHKDRFNKTIQSGNRKIGRLETRYDSDKIILDQLYHNVTDENIQRAFELEKLQVEISEEKNQQKKLEEEHKHSGIVVNKIRHAFQHFDDALDSIGDETFVKSPEYKTSYLKLPLLKMPGRHPPLKDPLHVETDVVTLIGNCKNKIQLLMKHYKKINPNEVQIATHTFQKKLLLGYEEQISGSVENANENDAEFDEMDASTHDDFSVPTRETIKLESRKIFVKNAIKKLDE